MVRAPPPPFVRSPWTSSDYGSFIGVHRERHDCGSCGGSRQAVSLVAYAKGYISTQAPSKAPQRRKEVSGIKKSCGPAKIGVVGSRRHRRLRAVSLDQVESGLRPPCCPSQKCHPSHSPLADLPNGTNLSHEQTGVAVIWSVGCLGCCRITEPLQTQRVAREYSAWHEPSYAARR